MYKLYIELYTGLQREIPGAGFTISISAGLKNQ